MLPQNSLHITAIQADLIWENPTENQKQFENKMNQIENTDLVVLPEMFTTGFSMNPQPLAEPMNGPSVQWMIQQAKERKIALTGSIIIQENNQFFNRLIWVFPNGEIAYYNKRHLFGMAGEDKSYTAGTQKKIINYKSWKICPLICYDLRFPVWIRNVEDYHFLIFVANWPKKRAYAWNNLLQARAIENQAFTLGVNRFGTDGNGFEYSGNSALYGPEGNEPWFHIEDKEGLISFELKPEELLRVKNNFPFLNDRDQFQIN